MSDSIRQHGWTTLAAVALFAACATTRPDAPWDSTPSEWEVGTYHFDVVFTVPAHTEFEVETSEAKADGTIRVFSDGPGYATTSFGDCVTAEVRYERRARGSYECGGLTLEFRPVRSGLEGVAFARLPGMVRRRSGCAEMVRDSQGRMQCRGYRWVLALDDQIRETRFRAVLVPSQR